MSRIQPAQDIRGRSILSDNLFLLYSGTPSGTSMVTASEHGGLQVTRVWPAHCKAADHLRDLILRGAIEVWGSLPSTSQLAREYWRRRVHDPLRNEHALPGSRGDGAGHRRKRPARPEAPRRYASARIGLLTGAEGASPRSQPHFFTPPCQKPREISILRAHKTHDPASSGRPASPHGVGHPIGPPGLTECWQL